MGATKALRPPRVVDAAKKKAGEVRPESDFPLRGRIAHRPRASLQTHRDRSWSRTFSTFNYRLAASFSLYRPVH